MTRITTLLFAIVLATVAFGQDQEEKNLDNGNLQEQFDYMMDKSNKYQSFKVVKRTWLEKFWTHVDDSMRTVKQDLNGVREDLRQSNATIEQLRSEIGGLNGNLENVTEERDSISFLGMNLDKGSYKTMMWSIVAALVLGFLLIFSQYKRSNKVTKETKSRFQEVTDEYDNYKKRTLEKEQQLKRELQDQINKSKF